MASYLYQTVLYGPDQIVIGKSPTNDADLIDFKANHKSAVEIISEIIIAETTFVLDISYATLEGFINGNSWGDVKLVQRGEEHMLYLESEVPL